MAAYFLYEVRMQKLRERKVQKKREERMQLNERKEEECIQKEAVRRKQRNLKICLLRQTNQI